ncbi:glycosyltransferase family 2 protein [Streptococcus mutans]|uniref:glycosyltransferase family 2 protein n=1 Tax=Streptococcus mutans TaxID=1309 RepID=UPI0002B595C2|nr:glycosyltransferase family 2 protein [Streptococcus mutans]EMB89751.1 putative glycosyltransferase [Streptococcus mutans NMT4863]EMC58179.1 putative glycosyltransferase [Streptococcus mutans OMZ175]EMP68435.1 glycosyltransferase [Streptococcus mutans NCTC 11060]MCB5063069.1 glycosyltransferase family 2 protein [Streptococcus mutans]QZS44746.1 glycosyltransferase family 2 protein [Streptococcus mutans OMZ175]
MKKLSIVIPCYNEEETIYPFLKETQKVERQMSDELFFDYYFINDGSSDKTLTVLREVAARFENVHYLSFSRNFGKEAALLAGLEAVDGDLITVMDADLQDPPELLIKMYSKLKQGYDVVGTRRADRKGEPFIRSLFAKTFYWLINKISSTEMVDGARDFRLMTRQVVDSILKLGEVNRFSKGLFSWVGFDVTYVAYENRERVAGKTSWSFWTLLRYSMDGFINFSEAPLNLATWTGAISFLLSIISILFIIIRKLTVGGSVTGWASMVSIILLIGGLQLLSLGIIGKYIAKIFLETKKRPVYIVKEKG